MSEMREIDVNLIDMNKDNEDIFGYEGIESLIQDISEEGFHGAIDVYQKPDGRYEIVSGHRRYQSALKNDMKTIPCIVEDIPDNVAKAKRLIMSNVLQRNMSPYNWARALAYYKENVLKHEKFKGKTRDELARRFSISATTVHRYLSLLNLIPEFLEYTKQVNCEYSIFDSVTGLSVSDQRELYGILSGMAVDGNILSLTRTLVSQTANRLVARKEQQKKQADNEGKPVEEPEKVQESLNVTSFDVEKNRSIPEFEPFDEGMTNEFISFDNAFVGEEKENETNDASVDGEIAYFINRIDMLLDRGQQIKNKAVHAEALKRLLEKMGR